MWASYPPRHWREQYESRTFDDSLWQAWKKRIKISCGKMTRRNWTGSCCQRNQTDAYSILFFFPSRWLIGPRTKWWCSRWTFWHRTGRICSMKSSWWIDSTIPTSFGNASRGRNVSFSYLSLFLFNGLLGHVRPPLIFCSDRENLEHP